TAGIASPQPNAAGSLAYAPLDGAWNAWPRQRFLSPAAPTFPSAQILPATKLGTNINATRIIGPGLNSLVPPPGRPNDIGISGGDNIRTDRPATVDRAPPARTSRSSNNQSSRQRNNP